MSNSNRRESKLDRISPIHIVLVAILAFLLIGLAGYLFIDRISFLEGEIAELNSELGETKRAAQIARDESEAASRRAEIAEKNARQAAEGRRSAEEEANLARTRSEKAEKEALQAKQEMEELRQQRAEELNRLKTALDRIVETRRTALGLVMNLDSTSIRFDFDDDRLKPANRELLSRIVGVLMTSSGYRVHVYGHTDDVGTPEYNQTLSERRANTVRDYLVEAGIDPEIISTTGMGKTNPLVEGTDPDSRARNRRVEIGIIDTMVSYERALPDGG